MSSLKDVLKERKMEKNKNELIDINELDFSNEIFKTKDLEINDFLKRKSFEVITINTKGSLALGKIYSEVFNRLSGSNRFDGYYEKWLLINGINKKTALRHRKRFEIYMKLSTENGKQLIALLPVRELEKLCQNEELYINHLNNGMSKDELKELLNKNLKLENEKEVIKDMDHFDYIAVVKKLENINLDSFNRKKREKIEVYLNKIDELLGR